MCPRAASVLSVDFGDSGTKQGTLYCLHTRARDRSQPFEHRGADKVNAGSNSYHIVGLQARCNLVTSVSVKGRPSATARFCGAEHPPAFWCSLHRVTLRHPLK